MTNEVTEKFAELFAYALDEKHEVNDIHSEDVSVFNLVLYSSFQVYLVKVSLRSSFNFDL